MLTFSLKLTIFTIFFELEKKKIGFGVSILKKRLRILNKLFDNNIYSLFHYRYFLAKNFWIIHKTGEQLTRVMDRTNFSQK